MKQDEQYEIDNPVIKALLKDIGLTLASTMPPNYGFALAIFSYGEGGDFFYLSTAMREDFIKMLDEWKKRLAEAKK